MDAQTGTEEKYLLYAMLSVKRSKSSYLVWGSAAQLQASSAIWDALAHSAWPCSCCSRRTWVSCRACVISASLVWIPWIFEGVSNSTRRLCSDTWIPPLDLSAPQLKTITNHTSQELLCCPCAHYIHQGQKWWWRR